MKLRKLYKLIGALALILAFAAVGFVHYQANAGPKEGDAMYRLAAIDQNSHVQRAVLLPQGVKTMANTTPVAGSTVCLSGDARLYAAELTLTGTIGAGTAPVITVVLQNSRDHGATWSSVGSAFAAINSTVTPAGGVEKITFSDQAGAINTATVYGDCFRVRYTFAGTAATTVANVGVTLLAK